ncbi:MAG: hypothetical protein ABI051_17315 [Vicinamibacterales bacterium]
MPPRQEWLFRLGCWVAFAVAGVHLAAHVFASGISPELVDSLNRAPPPFVFVVPGLWRPTTTSVISGMSLSMALLVTTLGAVGLILLKRGGGDDPLLLRGVARAFAVAGVGLLIVSIADFFSLQTFAIAVMAMCFALAAVPQE